MRVKELIFTRMPFLSPSSPRYAPQYQAATVSFTGLTAPTPISPSEW